MSMSRAALTHKAPAQVSKENRTACLSVTRVQIAPQCSNQADHSFTAPNACQLKNPIAAWEKYVSRLTLAAEHQTADRGQKG
jgi:hypothetical protein